MEEKLKKLLELKERSETATAEYKEYSAKFCEEMGDDDVFMCDGKKISKVIKRITKLRSDVSIETIEKEFPFAVEVEKKVNIKELEQEEDAHKYLTLDESKYILVNKSK